MSYIELTVFSAKTDAESSSITVVGLEKDSSFLPSLNHQPTLRFCFALYFPPSALNITS